MRKKIPATNNAGKSKVRLTPEEILKTPNYNFQLKILRRFLDETSLANFVQNYDKARKCGTRFVPKPEELKAFKEYSSGKISVAEFQNQIGAGSLSAAYTKLGKLYAFNSTKK